jgi:DnaK suppressor protein
LKRKEKTSPRKSKDSKRSRTANKKASAGSSTKAGKAVARTKSEKKRGSAAASLRTVSRAGAAKPKGFKAGSSSRVEQLKSMLEERRAEVLREIRRARQDGMEIDRTSFPEVGDLVSASVEKERAFEYGEIGVNLLREIDNALEKLKEGTYGLCELCNNPIGLKRLKVMPSARLCISCKSKEEASGR